MTQNRGYVRTRRAIVCAAPVVLVAQWVNLSSESELERAGSLVTVVLGIAVPSTIAIVALLRVVRFQTS